MSLGLSLGNRLGLGRGGLLNPYLLNLNFLDSAQYEPGGWLYENHSRDTGATVVDENGNVVWAPENLLDGSEGPTVHWTRTVTGVTHVLTGETYEGRVVHELTKTSAAGVSGYVSDHGQNRTLSENSRLYLSAKFEKTESPLIAWISFTNQGVASSYVALDLSDGNITGANGTGGNHEVIDDGDWWLVRTPVENVGGTGSDFFSIRFDPDEDAGAVLRFTQPMVSRGGFHEYIPSSGGNPTFAPRLQHDSAGNPLGYLHEPQATQHGPHWSDMTDRTWQVSNCAVSSESGGPLGAYNKLTPAADSTNKVANPFASINFNSTGDWTISAIAVADGWDYAFLQENTSGGARRSFFNLSTGAVHSEHANHTARITPMKDGHYLIEITFNVASTGSYFSGLGPSIDAASINGTGDGSSGVGFCGFQWEPGSVATSRIPTDGSSSVTRQADSPIPITDEFNSRSGDEFTLMLEFVQPAEFGHSFFNSAPGGDLRLVTNVNPNLYYTYVSGELVNTGGNFATPGASEGEIVQYGISYRDGEQILRISDADSEQYRSDTHTMGALTELELLQSVNAPVILRGVRILNRAQADADALGALMDNWNITE